MDPLTTNPTPTPSSPIKLNTVLLVILILIALFCAWKLVEKNTEVNNDNETVVPVGQTQTNQNPNGPDYQPNQNQNDSSDKTYTSNEYGFSFQYPSSWNLTEDKTKKSVRIDTGDTGEVVEGQTFPSWSISFIATDKSFFNSHVVSTKIGVIKYDENQSALVSDNRCLKASNLLDATNVSAISNGNTTSVKSIGYGGSMMSDPAYSNDAILTESGEIIIVHSEQGSPVTPQLSSQLGIVANSFKLLNGNKVFVPVCAQ